MRFFYPDQRQNTPWLRVSLLIVILASFGWRLHHLDFQSLWRDEVDAVWFALRDLPETLSMFIATGQNGALYFLSLRPWLSFIGSNEFSLRFPSVWAATLALPVLWQVARRLVNGNQSGVVQSGVVQGNQTANTIALVTVLLLASNPYQLWYSQEGKMYAIITCLSLLATLFWLRGVDRGGWRNWLAYLIIVSLAIYFHLLMILIIPLHMLWFVIGWPQAKRQWKGYLLAIAGLTLPYLPMLWWQWDLLMAQDKRTGFNFTPLPEMLLTLALNHSFGFAPRLGIIWLAPLIFLAFAGLLLGWEKSSEETKLASAEEGSGAGKDPTNRFASSLRLASWRSYLLILSWLVFPILEIYLLSLRQPVYTDRYIIWIAPAAAILVALGANSVRTIFGRPGVLMATALILFVVALWLGKGWQQKTTVLKFDLRGAVQLVNQQRSTDSLLILQIPHTEWAYRYYSSDLGRDPFAESDKRLARWAGGPWTNGGSSDADARRDVATLMEQMTAGAPEIWVIFSEATMWDARQLMDEWLDRTMQLVQKNDFYGVQVRHYSRK